MTLPALHPLLLRDYARTGCRPAAFIQRATAAGGVGLILIIAFAAALGDEQPDEIATTLVGTAEIIVCGAVLLHASSTTALALATERATGSLTVLLTVPRSPLSLSLGVLLSRVLRTLTEVLVFLPLLAMVVFTLGGVPGDRILRVCLNVLWSALFGSAAGLLAGHRFREHRHAGAASILALLVLMAALPGIVGLAWAVLDARVTTDFGREAQRMLASVAVGLWMATPSLAVIADCVGPPPFLPAVAGLGPWTLMQAASGAGALLLATVAVARASRRLGREADAEIADGMISTRRAGGPSQRAGPLPRDRPLSWKECRPARKAWHRWAFRGVGLGYAVLVVWMMVKVRERIAFGWNEEGARFSVDLMIAVPAWVLVLAVFAGTTTFIAEERERGSLDLLRVAPLRTWDYVIARPEGTLRRAVPMLVLCALLWLAGAISGTGSLWAFPAAVLGAAALLPLAALGGFALGVSAPTVRKASQRVSLMVFGLVFAWPFLAGWLGTLTRPSDKPALALLGLDPVAGMLTPFVLVQAWDEAGRRGGDAAVFLAAGFVSIVASGIAAGGLRAVFAGASRRMLDEG